MMVFHSLADLAFHYGLNFHTIQHWRKLRLIPKHDGPRCDPIYGPKHIKAVEWIIAQRSNNCTFADLQVRAGVNE
jgi:hypothetical protein